MLIISHNTMAVLFLPLIIGYILIGFYGKKENRGKYPTKNVVPILLGVGLSSFFIIPALSELRYTQFANVQVSDPLKYFAAVEVTGFISYLIISAAIVVYLRRKIIQSNQKFLFLYFFVLSVLAVNFSSPASAFFWEIIPSSWIQFPFRLLSVLLVAVPFLTAFLIDRLKKTGKLFIIFIITVVGVMSALPFISPKDFFVKDDSYYFTNQATTTVRDEYMPLWVKEKAFKSSDEKIEVLSGQAVIKNVFYNNSKITFEAISQDDAVIRVNTLFWPGWRATVDGEPISINYDNDKGVMDLRLDQGVSKVEINFGETPLRLVANLISIMSFVLLTYYTRRKGFNR